MAEMTLCGISWSLRFTDKDVSLLRPERENTNTLKASPLMASRLRALYWEDAAESMAVSISNASAFGMELSMLKPAMTSRLCCSRKTDVELLNVSLKFLASCTTKNPSTISTTMTIVRIKKKAFKDDSSNFQSTIPATISPAMPIKM